MDLKEEGFDGWHRGGRRLFQVHAKSLMKDDGTSAWIEKRNTKHIGNSKPGTGGESKLMRKPSLV